ncbi:MAG: tetratricopeptide repeat protein [Congregibacter sp.]
MSGSIFAVNDAIDEAGRLARQGAHEEAKQLYDQVLAASPGNKRAKKGLKTLRLRSNIALSPADFARVGRLMESGKLNEALADLNRLCRANPEQPALFNLLGVALSRTARKEAALEAFKTAWALQSDFWDALNNLASTFTDLERYEEALECFHTLIKQGDPDATIYTNLARALKGAKQHDNAVEALRRALQLSPLSVEAHNNLGNLLNQIGRHKEALAAYESALSIDPQYATARLNKARMLSALDRNDTVEKAG